MILYLGCVGDPEVRHGAIGHHDVLTGEALLVTGQMGTQNLRLRMGSSDPLVLDHDHLARRADVLLRFLDAVVARRILLIS